MSKVELGGASDLETASRLYVGLAECSRHDIRKPITASTSRVPRDPHEVPVVENLDLGHVLQAWDGALYRKETS